MEKNRKRRFS